MKQTPPPNPTRRADRLEALLHRHRSAGSRRHRAQRPRLGAVPQASLTAASLNQQATDPALRLVGTDPEAAGPNAPTPITGATDPRWVLAVRTAESLQGDILPPEKRERLIALAKMMGLTPFDGCLIIAMVQDQARRGLLADHGPAGVGPQLSMIPLPRPRRLFAGLRENPGQVAMLTAGILALQGLFVWMLIG